MNFGNWLNFNFQKVQKFNENQNSEPQNALKLRIMILWIDQL